MTINARTTSCASHSNCWTCNKNLATHREWEDVKYGEYYYTCNDCHKKEYPELYDDSKLPTDEYKID